MENMAQRKIKKILLVDDSRIVRQFLKLVLRKHLLCDITEACDGLAAVQSMRADKYDLMITDINMPNMDGLALIRKVRKEMGLNLPIIIITTLGKENDRDTGLELGANSYLTKPINAPKLVGEATGLLS